MDKSGEDPVIDYDAYPMTESYWSKRIISYLIDTAMAFVIMLVIFVFILNIWDTGITTAWVLLLLLATGITTWIGKSVFEYTAGTSPGKGIMKLRLVSAYDRPTFGELLIRNLSSVLIIIGPGLDLISRSSTDPREKKLDSISNTLVVEDLVMVEERPSRPIMTRPIEEPRPREKMSLGFPDRMRTGTCPRCGAPYRILDPGDEGFSGLWNYRCTWCNFKVFER
jgi:uncharacterized RDD family membrane protein YckC